MGFPEKVSVLELLLHLLKENETKLESLIEKMEIIDKTIQQNPTLSKTVKEHDPSTNVESLSQNILVVDDDKNLANSFKLILESVGHTVNTAYSGIQALYMMKKRSYNLILLDLNLPIMKGDDVAEMIEEHHNHVDIVFITGYSTLKDEVDGFGNGKKTILKPIGPDVLLETASKQFSDAPVAS